MQANWPYPKETSNRLAVGRPEWRKPDVVATKWTLIPRKHPIKHLIKHLMYFLVSVLTPHRSLDSERVLAPYTTLGAPAEADVCGGA